MEKVWVAWGTWEFLRVAQENWALCKIPKMFLQDA
jgi:hypothetical protein